MSSYTAIHLAERPVDNIVPGKTFETKQHPLPDASSLQDGEVLFKTLYLSLDPAMRGWLRDRRSYIPPVQIGEVMRGFSIGIIEASKSDKYPKGSFATGMSGWAEYTVLNANNPAHFLGPVNLPKGAIPTDALGVLGMTALTAYFGMLDIGQVKAGDFVVVSAAAGATGSVAGQIAKLKGARVLGLAGGEDKVRWLKEELGFDDALDYKDPDFRKKFREATKDLIDVYFDNVGGEILDMALAQAKPFARFVQCGAISEYNKEKPDGIKNYIVVVTMRLRMQGFNVLDYRERHGEAQKQIAQWLSEGKIQRKDTIVKGGLPQAESALLGLFEGKNTGKMVVEIARPEDMPKL